MPEPDLLELFVAPLEAIGVRYLVTGSVAATLYGEPRATHDIDLVVDLAAGQAAGLPRAFPEDAFYLPPPEVVRVESEPATEGDGRRPPGSHPGSHPRLRRPLLPVPAHGRWVARKK